MNYRRLLGVALTSSFLATASTGVAQPLENPVYFDLPAQPNALFGTKGGEGPGVPSTFQIGEVDPSVKANGTQAPLNDLVIVNGTLNTQAGLNQRVYTIRHTSGTDTRALSLETPQDISLGDNCFFEISSLQLIDVNNDAINDAVYATNQCFVDSISDLKLFGDLGRARIIGMAGTGAGGGDAFTGGPVSLGFQQDATLPSPTDVFYDASQPVIAADQFRNGSGRQDIAFYDALEGDLLTTLQNDGTLELLTANDTPIQGLEPELGNSGSAIVSGDFNGDGNQDVAMLFQGEEGDPSINSRLKVFLGDGAGGFSESPAADVDLGGFGLLHGLASGDFDGNGFLDFVTIENPIDEEESTSQVLVVTCAPASPQANCSVNSFSVNPAAENIGISVTTGDFDSDGLDDLAFSQIFDGESLDLDTGSQVQVHLNRGGNFNVTADQTLVLNPEETLPENYIIQVIAKDIDACGGPDLAYIGLSQEFTGPSGLAFSKFQALDKVKNGTSTVVVAPQAAVAFNANETPIADAGNGNSATVGGEPTCTDPSGDAMTIQWTVVSGTASISDANASNPTITNASQGAVLQVTCTDSCGASASDQVTLIAGGLIEGSGCALSTGLTSTSGLALLAGLFLALPLLRLRRRE